MKKMLFLLAVVTSVVACDKNGDTGVSAPKFKVGGYIQAGDTLNSKNGSNGRAIKGTLESGKVYYLHADYADAVVNANDTLYIQDGVTVYIVGDASGEKKIGSKDHAPALYVNGSLYAIGTKEKPITFTVKDNSLKSDSNKDPQPWDQDPAMFGLWGGIQGQSGSGDIVIKWTHLEYLGGPTPTGDPQSEKYRWGIKFCNPSKALVLEDSWIYGTSNDAVRIDGGKFHIMRNTFEKIGTTTGEAINIKTGSEGNACYNVVIGVAAHAFKAANKAPVSPQCNLVMYNNTIVNSGFRNTAQAGTRGGAINYEEGAKGLIYNNLIVNCKYGFKIIKKPAPDVENIHYGNNYYYGDVTEITEQFIAPQLATTEWMDSDVHGGAGENNPMFLSYSMPAKEGAVYPYSNYNYQPKGSSFKLPSVSPAKGVGTTSVIPLSVVKVDPVFGASEITLPGKDAGAYQTDGTGNQH